MIIISNDRQSVLLLNGLLIFSDIDSARIKADNVIDLFEDQRRASGKICISPADKTILTTVVQSVPDDIIDAVYGTLSEPLNQFQSDSQDINHLSAEPTNTGIVTNRLPPKTQVISQRKPPDLGLWVISYWLDNTETFQSLVTEKCRASIEYKIRMIPMLFNIMEGWIGLVISRFNPNAIRPDNGRQVIYE